MDCPSSRPRVDAARPAWAWLVAAALTFVPRLMLAQAVSPDVGAWQYLQGEFYGTRDIGEVDERFMSLEAPANTPDPAATPLTLHFGAAAIGHIKEIRIIIDNNPSPVVATIDVGAAARLREIGLRVRIDRFTSVRAIAETTDGRLEMRSRWVNASGGCSAAPSAAAGGTIGQMRFRPTPDGKALQISIRHPNHSGFQIDPVSGDAIPPHFVSHIRILAGGHALIDAATGISISENPTLRLVSDVALPMPVAVDALDSKGGHFHAVWGGGDAAR
ncbi:MAG: quinoprotein dehydrogenase-associated SoxYZ-like carrier [Gammaproteobacteria bacterium]|nr:quinoprotein dehydrogenase-associated SoxYZ-like carrier [Gammaproteobacteria bacterium]